MDKVYHAILHFAYMNKTSSMNHKSAILYGIAIWAFVFVVAMFAFPLRESERPLFESIMPVALALAASFATARSFRLVQDRFAVVGLCLGLIWMGISLLLDAALFSWGPMKMSLGNYITDIGVTYLMLLVIPWMSGWGLQLRFGAKK